MLRLVFVLWLAEEKHPSQRSQRKGWLRDSGAREVPQNVRRLVPAQMGGPCRAGSKLHPHLQWV